MYLRLQMHLEILRDLQPSSRQILCPIGIKSLAMFAKATSSLSAYVVRGRPNPVYNHDAQRHAEQALKSNENARSQ
jgi:hypothetical protein